MSLRTKKGGRRWSIGRVVATGIGLIGSLISFAPIGALFAWTGGAFPAWLASCGLAWIAILLHELGHAIVGASAGRTILRFYVIPIELRFRPFSLHFSRKVLGRDLGGAVVFKNDPYASRRDRALLSLAGPAANFVTAVLLVGLAYVAPSAAPELVASMVGISLTLGIANLVPFETSDGAMILKVLRGRV